MDFPDIGGTIDSAFNTYLQTIAAQRKQNEDRTLKNLELAQTFGPGVTVEGLQANPNALTQAGAMAQTPGPIPGQAQGADPLTTALANWQRRQQAAMALGVQKTQSELGKEQADTRAANAKAAHDEFINGLLGGAPGQPGAGAPAAGEGGGLGSGGNLIQRVVAAVKSGQITPGQADEYMSRNPDAHLAYLSELTKQGVDVKSLELANKKQQATAQFEGGSDVQKPARLMRSLVPSLDYLQKIATERGPSDYKLINKYGLKLAAEKGDPTAQEILDVANATADEYQAMIGGGSDAKLELGFHLFDTAKNGPQIARTVNFVKQNLANRANALEGKEMGGPIQPPPPLERMGRLPGAKASVPLISMDGGKTWSPKAGGR